MNKKIVEIINQIKINKKILKLMNKEYSLSKKEISLFKELKFQCDLKIQDKDGLTPLMYALTNNKTQNLNLSEEQWNYLIKNSDLKQQNKEGDTPLMYALKYNQSKKLNLNKDQLEYLLKNSDLKQKNNLAYTPLMYALIYNKKQNLNINKEQWDYILKNSDLKQQNIDGWTPLMLAFICNKYQNLQLSSKQFQTMYNALDKEEQQTNFQNLIHEICKNKYNYVEEMNVLFYDCEFKPNEKTLIWLKKNQHQDILERIEKRDLFFQLNQDLIEINNHQKIATIKL